MAKKPTDIPANGNTKAVLEGAGAAIGSYSGQLEFADVNGDGKADFQIEVHGVTMLTAGDFAL